MAPNPNTLPNATDDEETVVPAGRLQQARERTAQLAGQAADRARNAGEKVADNPLAIVAGGIAIGALIGLLIPVSRREKELLSPLGERLSSTARETAQSAYENGRTRLNEVTGQFVSQVGDAVADAVGQKED